MIKNFWLKSFLWLIILSPRHFYANNFLDNEKNRSKIEPNIFYCPQNVWSIRNSGPIKYWVQVNFGSIIIVCNKTWSSLSNSNLSKPFVLGSLESLKIRSSVLSLQRSFSLEIYCQTKFWTEISFVTNKFWVPKNLWSKETSGPKKLLVDYGGVLLVLLVTRVIRTPTP